MALAHARRADAVNSSAKADVTKTREDRIKDSAKNDAKKEYNRRASGGAHASRDRPQGALRQWRPHGALQGHDREESAPLLNYLFGHMTRPEFTCRFRWEPGSIALWDNRCTQHNPVNDYHGFRRVMHRVTLAGDVPR
jgi:taurine dioxygenase